MKQKNFSDSSVNVKESCVRAAYIKTNENMLILSSNRERENTNVNTNNLENIMACFMSQIKEYIHPDGKG